MFNKFNYDSRSREKLRGNRIFEIFWKFPNLAKKKKKKIKMVKLLKRREKSLDCNQGKMMPYMREHNNLIYCWFYIQNHGDHLCGTTSLKCWKQGKTKQGKSEKKKQNLSTLIFTSFGKSFKNEGKIRRKIWELRGCVTSRLVCMKC